MYLDTNECFKNTGKINSTRFGDFYVMASKGETVKIIDNINDFDELVEHMNNIHSIKIK